MYLFLRIAEVTRQKYQANQSFYFFGKTPPIALPIAAPETVAAVPTPAAPIDCNALNIDLYYIPVQSST